ncbi:MAG TPA: serine hydrolase domain-containing protein, partial [Blastocatellia bacterium]|nr:serine hydrolase domain-containing protein [Blastocatellia bacterium]
LAAPYADSSSFSGDILVARAGKVIFNRGYGLADRARSVPVTPQTRFYIASISKSFTAAAILLLQDRGKLRVEDRVARFIPDFPNGDRVTIHHLLTHTSGIVDYLRFPNFAELSKRRYKTADVLPLFRDKPLAFNPGERSSYSNSNYVLLAHIIETVAGTSYVDFLRRNFFTPLGMKDTGEPGLSNQSVINLASGYTPVGLRDFETARYFDRSILTGAGSLYSTTEDLNRWVEGLFAGRVLKKSSVELMYKAGPGLASGYSWTLGKLWGREVVTGNGWDGVGFSGTLFHFPADRVTVVVLNNLNIASVASELANTVSALVVGGRVEPLTISRDPLSSELAARLAGRYKLGDDFFVPGTVLEIVERDGSLYERQRDPDRLIGLIRVAELEFIHRSSWGRVKFEIGEGGQVTGMLFYGRFKASKLSESLGGGRP